MKKIYLSGFADEISADFGEQLTGVTSLGMEYVCLRTLDKKSIAEYTPDEVKKYVLPKLNEAGIKVSSLGSPIGKVQIDDEEGFEKQKAQLETLCKVCEILNCKYIRMFSFYLPKDENPEIFKIQVVKKLREFVEIAEKYNVILIHENEKDIYGDTLDRCCTLFEEIKSDSFKAAFDFANFVQCKQDTLECWDKLKKHVAYIHIKDATTAHNENVLCGTGEGKIEEILNEAINKDGYEGFLTLEPHLFLFEALQSLEIEDAKDIIKVNKYETSIDAYKAQLDAVKNILTNIL